MRHIIKKRLYLPLLFATGALFLRHYILVFVLKCFLAAIVPGSFSWDLDYEVFHFTEKGLSLQQITLSSKKDSLHITVDEVSLEGFFKPQLVLNSPDIHLTYRRGGDLPLPIRFDRLALHRPRTSQLTINDGKIHLSDGAQTLSTQFSLTKGDDPARIGRLTLPMLTADLYSCKKGLSAEVSIDEADLSHLNFFNDTFGLKGRASGYLCLGLGKRLENLSGHLQVAELEGVYEELSGKCARLEMTIDFPGKWRQIGGQIKVGGATLAMGEYELGDMEGVIDLSRDPSLRLVAGVKKGAFYLPLLVESRGFIRSRSDFGMRTYLTVAGEPPIELILSHPAKNALGFKLSIDEFSAGLLPLEDFKADKVSALIEGTPHQARGEILFDEERVTFGTHFSVSEGLKIESAHFRGDGISEVVYASALSYFPKDWTLKGIADIEGFYDSTRFDFAIQPIDLIFESPELYANLSEDGGSGAFHFDINHKSFVGDLIIEDVELEESRFGLSFEDVNARVRLRPNVVEILDLSAMSHGMHLKGEVIKRKGEEEEIEIKIDHIDGSAEGLIAFLKPFSLVGQLPLTGKVIGDKEAFFLTARGNEASYKAQLSLKEGTLPLSEHFAASDMTAALTFSSEGKKLLLKDVRANLTYDERDLYAIDARYLAFDSEWNYDLRISSRTRDLIHFVGTLRLDDQFSAVIDAEKSHFFNEKIALAFESGLDRITLDTTLCPSALMVQIDYLSKKGLFAIDACKLPTFEGALAVKLNYEQGSGDLLIESDNAVFGGEKLSRISLAATKRLDQVRIEKGCIGDIVFSTLMELKETSFDFPTLSISYRDNGMSFDGASLSKEKRQLTLPLVHSQIDLHFLKKYLPKHVPPALLKGYVDLFGKIKIDLFNRALAAELELAGEDLTEWGWDLKSAAPFSVAARLGEGLHLHHLDLSLSGMKLGAEHLYHKNGDVKIEGAALSLSPEIVDELLKTDLLPIPDLPFDWENEIGLTCNLKRENEEWQGHGELKSGYYWWGLTAWHLEHTTFAFSGEKIDIALKTFYRDEPLHLKGEINLGGPYLLYLQEEKHPDRTLFVRAYQSDERGLYLERIEGNVFGFDARLLASTKMDHPGVMMLSGSLKVDFPHLASVLPEPMVESLKNWGIGGGYEMSGDLVLFKDHPTHSYFQGYLKGRNFLFKGIYFKTLLSEVRLSSRQVNLTNFTLSDEAGLVQMKEMNVLKVGEKWKLLIPELSIEDLRPSLLKKEGHRIGRLKPFTVRHLSLRGLKGTIGQPGSFRGSGDLDFINTFKRSTNLLDIPIEIISRIGLDASVLIPVRGELDFEIRNSKIVISSLHDCFSESKRSKFKLHERTPSYVDFDGNFHIDIKMKQYVLLRLTQPFVLSIRGDLEKPRYSLK